MEEKNREVLEQYDISISGLRRVKGMLLVETEEGQRILRMAYGSEQRYRFQDVITKKLYEQGFHGVDRIVRNRSGNALTSNALGDIYIMKEYFEGEECNPNSAEEAVLGARNLARLHEALEHIDISGENIGTYCQENLGEAFARRLRELKRVRGYLREKKKKNLFEVLYCTVEESFCTQAAEACKEFAELTSEKETHSSSDLGVAENEGKCRQREYKEIRRGLTHGKYCHHNVIFLKNLREADNIATIGFEHCAYGFQVSDLYYYIRKLMEKNSWDIALGSAIIGAYDEVHRLSAQEMRLLYIMLLFPEKFWKITNYYYNGKKTWIPGKNYHKLQSVAQQFQAKERFLEYLR